MAQTAVEFASDNKGIRALRTVAKLLIVSALLVPLNASPLGLGDIRLNSALNRPLDAEIDLMSLGATRPDDVSVKLGSPAAFEAAGVDRPLYLTRLNFTVESRPDGSAYIKVKSAQGITEPFLDLLIEVDWPNGKLVREYTVLLDPPLVTDEPPAAVAAPAATPAAPAVAAAPVPSEAAPLAGETPSPPHTLTPSVAKAANGAWTYGPVARDGTLYSIAQELRALDPNVSIEQIMIALLRSNPQAFYNDNINELKAGYVLRIEDPAAIHELAQAAAAAEVRRQTAQWLAAKSGGAVSGQQEAGEIAAPASEGAAAGAAETGPRLRLRAPEASEAEKPAAGATERPEAEAQSGEIASLRNDLTAALEASAAARQENVELRERLAKLEEQIASMQRLLTLKDETMATMQAGRSGPAAAQPGPQGVRTLLNDPIILAAAGIAVLVIITLGWLITRRVRMARASLEEFTRIEERGDEALQVSGGAVAAAAASGAAPGLVVETAVEQGRAEEAGVDILQAEDDEIDVLAEADVYFAYRRFDKAEELLREALKDEPGRRDLAAKLLEVYAASGNGEAFVREATALKAGLEPGDASMWDKIAAMGRRVAPGHALFEPAAAPAAAAAKPAAQAENSLSLHELTDIDFEKELGALDDQPVTAVSAAAAQASGENELADLDLTLDEATLARLRQPDGGAIESSVTSTLNAGQVPFAGEPKAKAAEGGAGDIDWLSAAGEDLLKFEDDVQGESESTLISGEDEVDTKLDLAKAYIDMGDQESARNILNEVANEGDQNQQREAHDLMRQIG